MSTDYELVCKKHKHRCDISTDGMSGPMLNCGKSLAFFVVTHCNCDLVIMSEHQLDDDYYDTFVEWNKDNCKELLDYDIDKQQ